MYCLQPEIGIRKQDKSIFCVKVFVCFHCVDVLKLHCETLHDEEDDKPYLAIQHVRDTLIPPAQRYLMNIILLLHWDIGASLDFTKHELSFECHTFLDYGLSYHSSMALDNVTGMITCAGTLLGMYDSDIQRCNAKGTCTFTIIQTNSFFFLMYNYNSSLLKVLYCSIISVLFQKTVSVYLEQSC